MDEQNNNSNNTAALSGADNSDGGRKIDGDVVHQGNIVNNNITSSDVAPIPSSPFEIRRHRSFYDTTTSNNSGAASKRRASSKSGMNKAKQSAQILNFFRSQSHEPKPGVVITTAAATGNTSSSSSSGNNNSPIDPPAPPAPVVPGNAGVSTSVVAKDEVTTTTTTDEVISGGGGIRPRRMRPQSLYTKTTSSKGVYMHRVSGIQTTPESPPEVGETFREYRRGSSNFPPSKFEAGNQNHAAGHDPKNSVTAKDLKQDESGDEGAGTLKASGGGATGSGGDDAISCSQSSSSSSDSYISCEGGGSMRRRDLLASCSDRSDLQNYDGDDSFSPNSNDNRQSVKHLSVGAPMRTGGSSNKSGSGEGSDTGLPPMTTSKSRQKKFHRHFKTVPPDEKVLDYYSCALVGDILLQGFLYITENYFAFYSNVFGYVTKVLIPVCSVVRITKERTAKIFPNAVGVCTRTEKHVFASLISRDTTFKLMCKVWNYSIEQEAEEIRALQRRVAAQVEAEDAFSGDVPVPDESSGDSGSGNDSAMEPSSHSPSPQNTPGYEKLVQLKAAVPTIPTHLVAAGTVVSGEAVGLISGGRISSVVEEGPISILNYRGAAHHIRNSISGTTPSLDHHYANATLTNAAASSTKQRIPQQSGGQFRRAVRNLGKNVGGTGPSLLMIATALLVILFLSAALLLSRISSLQQKLMERPVIHDSEQFYQDLLSWQTKLHSTTGDEIHQYINSNLQQIVKVRESLEALSMLFVNRPQTQQGAGGILGGEGEHHAHTTES